MRLAPDLDATFAALADPTRRAILERLADGEATVMELAEPFAMTQPAISHHLAVLERAGLIVRGRDGRRRPCRLQVAPLDAVTEWVTAYRERWEAAYQRLDALLVEVQRARSEETRPRASHASAPVPRAPHPQSGNLQGQKPRGPRSRRAPDRPSGG